MQTHNNTQAPDKSDKRIKSQRRITAFSELASLQPTQIAIYGGSFDPPHLGHMKCIKKLATTNEFVVVLPLGKNPYKPNQPYASDLNRLEMLDSMLEGLNNVFVCTEEIDRAIRTASATRTIDTLRLARQELAQTQLKLVVGADCLESLHLWNNFKCIFELADPLVFKRPGYQLNWQQLIDNLGWEIVSKIRANILETGYERDISSSTIRQAISQNSADLHELLPVAVVEYIQANKLYSKKSS